jgi:hypothetical protein
MTNAEIFNIALAEFGGRLELEKRAGTPAGELYARISVQAKDLIAVARQAVPRLPPIHFDLVYNKAVNAYAFKKNGQYFIGITSGTFVVLQLIFCRMLADSRLLRHAGEPDKEASDLPPLTGFVPDAHRIAVGGVRIPLPKTKPRWLYSCYLLDQAVLFMIGHEIAHITRGHVDYLDSRTGIAVLPEIGLTKPNPMDLIERQTLEGDADQRSFFSRLASAYGMATTANAPAPPWQAAPATLEQMFFDCTLYVGSFFRAFGDNRFAGMDIAHAWYPPEPLRRANLMMFAAQFAQNTLSPDVKDVATAALRSGSMACESAFAAITGESVIGAGLNDALSHEGRAHMELLSNCWTGGLRGRLAPFAYEPL